MPAWSDPDASFAPASLPAGVFDQIPDFAAVLAATDPSWYLFEGDYEPTLERELESRFSVSNGFIGIRGSLDIPGEASEPRTYVAGLFDLRPGPPAISALVPAPFAFPVSLSIDGEQLEISSGETIRHLRLLDYGSGSLRMLWQQKLPSGREVALESLRFVSRATPRLGVQLLRLDVEEGASIRLQAPAIVSPQLAPSDEPNAWITSNGAIAVACRRELLYRADDRQPSPWQSAESADVAVDCRRRLSLLQLTGYELHERPQTAAARARETLQYARHQGPAGLHQLHGRSWRERWSDSDVIIEGDRGAQQALRFAVYHLNSAADPGNSRSSVGARALTGDGYMGHVFWDTEAFMVPFYVFTWPEAARSLLEYRFRTLPAARDKARRLGFRGALYAWESTDSGEETTPPYAMGPRGELIAIRNGDLEHHVSSAVAYATWLYWQATGDESFLLQNGADIILETARFWASRCHPEGDGQYHIRNVIGPDEYHDGVDDNAYTNWMARWNIERGLELVSLLESEWPTDCREILGRLGVTDAELASWRSVSQAVYVPVDGSTGVLEQFAGYFALEDIDLSAYAPRAAPMDMLLGPERTRRSQVVKQADVVMLLALLPGEFSAETARRCYEYYEPRCGHGSSLSPPMHSLVAARLGLLADAERYFLQTAAIDLDDSMGNSAAGLHMAALGGLWQAAVLGLGGLMLRSDGVVLQPCLPDAWTRLRFPFRWHGRRVSVDASRERGLSEVRLEEGEPLTIYSAGARHRLERGQPLLLPLAGEGTVA